MIEIAVNNLAAATGARTVTGEADRVCRGCVIDSRQVEEGPREGLRHPAYR